MAEDGLVVATAFDSTFASLGLNLVGSIHRHAPSVDRILVYDLGLSPKQRRRFDGAERVEVRAVPPFVEHWRACWSWKPWVWRDALNGAGRVLYLDAGTTVKGELTEVVQFLDEDGYFAVSQDVHGPGSHPLADIVPVDWYERFAVPPAWLQEPVVSAG